MNSLTVSFQRVIVTYDVTLQYATISIITALISNIQAVNDVLPTERSTKSQCACSK
jgi:hypothetical protein